MAPDRISPRPTPDPHAGHPSPSRLASLDALRGLIIVLMAIDHARGFIARNHPSEFWGTPLPDYQGDWLAFVTRLVTHLCAPGFMFLMGAGAALFARSRARAGWSSVRIARHLLLRGLVLIVAGPAPGEHGGHFRQGRRDQDSQLWAARAGGAWRHPVVLGVLYGLGSALQLRRCSSGCRPGGWSCWPGHACLRRMR